jgi:regulator of ribosome biosynthesis
MSISRDSTQLLYNSIFSLPTNSNEDGIFVELPEPITKLPREKPCPKEKQPTRWERFAKEKGIQNRKKSRKVFDEASGEYRPRWGYGSAKNDPMNDWVIPVPENSGKFPILVA